MKYKVFSSVTLSLFLAVMALISCKDGKDGNSVFKAKSIAGLKNELRLLEIDSIKNLIILNGSIDTIDEGWLFSHRHVTQLSLTVQSKACVARMKDVTVAVDFISKTQSKIGEKQITIYEFIEPNNFFTYKEIIEIPGQTAKVDFRLLNVVGE